MRATILAATLVALSLTSGTALAQSTGASDGTSDSECNAARPCFRYRGFGLSTAVTLDCREILVQVNTTTAGGEVRRGQATQTDCTERR